MTSELWLVMLLLASQAIGVGYWCQLKATERRADRIARLARRAMDALHNVDGVGAAGARAYLEAAIRE